MATGFLNSPHMPLRSHENILVFGGTIYYPQLTTGHRPYRAITGTTNRHTIRDKNIGGVLQINDGTRHPRSVQLFQNETGFHPTQKPVALYDYLIRTYTQPGELVLDFCCGSGTTAVAAQKINRRFIAGDQSAEYVAIARKRLAEPYTLDFMTILEQQEVG